MSLNQITKIAPNFKRQKAEEPLLDVSNVVAYFLTRDRQRIAANGPGEEIAKVKLQKLLYYAKGHVLAETGKILFRVPMVKYLYGPYIEVVNNKFEEYKTAPSVDLSQFDSEIAHHLDTVYEMKRHSTAQDLTAASHGEDPWKKVAMRSEITDQSLEAFFSNPEQHLEYLLASTFKASYTSQRLQNSLVELKRFINSQGELNSFMVIKDKIEALNVSVWERLEVLAVQCPFFARMRWLHQSVKESLLGYLFFPQELIDLYEMPVSLYGREIVRFKLAYAAKYKHPMALQYLSEMLALEGGDEAEDEEGNRADDPLEETKGIARAAAKRFSEETVTYFTRTSQVDEANPFLRAVSFLKLEDRNAARGMFERAIVQEPQDGESLYWLGVLSQDDRSDYYSRAAAAGYGKARLHQAKIAPTREQSFQLYLEAAQAGVVEAWYNLGKLIEQSVSPLAVEANDSIFYIEEAGHRGMLVSYSFAARIVTKQGDLQRAKDFHKARGDGGDAQGYYDLAKILEREGAEAEALEYYKKAGPLFGMKEALALEELLFLDTAEARKAEWTHAYRGHLDALIKIASNQEDQIDGD